MNFILGWNLFSSSKNLSGCIHRKAISWEISHSMATVFDVTAYKGPRFRQTWILDVKTHLKPTNKFQYVHYSSNNPKHIKKTIVTGECHRFLKSNSSVTTFHKTINNHITNLRKRGYPKNLCTKLTKKSTHTQQKSLLKLKKPTPRTKTLRTIHH